MPTPSDFDTSYSTLADALASNPSENLFTEPPSPASIDNPPLYPFNQSWDSEAAHSIQLDDTPGRERVRIQHGKSKNFIEMHPNGDQVVKVFGEGFDITVGKKNIYVSGPCNIVVIGDCNMQVGGDFNQQINGDYNLAIKGKMNIRGVQDIKISGDADVSIAANEQYGGALILSASESVNIGSDVYVDGSVLCDSLTAESRIDAGMGVSAGPYGFTSALGGLSLGVPSPATPIAVPGSITTVGPITSLVAVNAPLGKFGLSSSVLMTDTINTSLYDFHIHPTPKGPSGLPSLSMF
jgi:hypothetical protein